MVKQTLMSENILLEAEEKTNNNVRKINQHVDALNFSIVWLVKLHCEHLHFL